MIESSTSLVSSIVLPVFRSISAPTDSITDGSSSIALVRVTCEALVLDPPELVEALADAEQGRHPVLLGEQLEEVDQLGVAAADRLPDALPLLHRGEVGTEEEDLQIAIGRDRVGDLAELIADLVQRVMLLGDVEQRLAVDTCDLFHG